MPVKTDAMIAHGGAEGYTLHIDYDPENDAFEVMAIFNDGTVKTIDGSLVDGSTLNSLISREITNIETDSPVIGTNAFRGCRYLISVIATKAARIDTTAFGYCPALRYVYISDVCTSIHNSAFTSILNNDPLVIDCGFSADSPAAVNAPWGATGNVTINYDVSEPNPPVMSVLSLSPNPGLIQSIDAELEPAEDIQPVEPEPAVVKKTTRKAAK